MGAAHGRPRAAGRLSAPGEEGARRSRRRRREERRRTGRRRRGWLTRLEDRRHAPARRSGRRLSILEGPVREPRLVLAAGDAVCTGKGCRQEVRRGAGRAVAGAKSACVTRGWAIQERGGDVANVCRRGGGRQWQAGSVAGRTFTGSPTEHVGAPLPSAWDCSACLPAKAVRVCVRQRESREAGQVRAGQ